MCDGSFMVHREIDAKNLRINLRLSGKTLSEVVPLGVLAPLAAIGIFVQRSSSPPSTQPVLVQPSRNAPAPAPTPRATRAPKGKGKSGDPCEGGQ